MKTSWLLAASLIANVVLSVVVAVGWRGEKKAEEVPTVAPPRGPDALCDTARGDLDFFIEGLQKGNDPFYTPLAIRTLGPVLAYCLPHQRSEIDRAMAFLRERMAYLVAANATPAQKAQAHDEVLRSFIHLRGYFDSI
jgi:hypothetical protein